MILTKTIELTNHMNGLRMDLHELFIEAESLGEYGKAQIWIPRTQEALDIMHSFNDDALNRFLSDEDKYESTLILENLEQDEIGRFDGIEVVVKDGLNENSMMLVCEINNEDTVL